MEQKDFLDMLAREGYAPPVVVERAPDGRLDEHTHPFEAKALILDGEIRILTAAADRVYRPGDVFHLPTGEPHSESYGPQGVRYLSGRR
jgi:quercetin dioxygenase-like cupin family protein